MMAYEKFEKEIIGRLLTLPNKVTMITKLINLRKRAIKAINNAVEKEEAGLFVEETMPTSHEKLQIIVEIIYFLQTEKAPDFAEFGSNHPYKRLAEHLVSISKMDAKVLELFS